MRLGGLGCRRAFGLRAHSFFATVGNLATPLTKDQLFDSGRKLANCQSGELSFLIGYLLFNRSLIDAPNKKEGVAN